MFAYKRFQVCRSFFLILCILVTRFGFAGVADTNTVSETEGKAAEAVIVGSQESLRSNLQIQEQLHNALLAIEKNRQEAEAAAARNAELLEGRLNLMERAFASQRLEELKNIEHSDRMILIAAGSFAAMGFVVLLAAAFLQWTAVNRLAAVAATLPANQTVPALGMGDGHLMPPQMLEQSTARFLGVIERLEQRIQAMEISYKAPQHLPETSSANGDSNVPAELTVSEDSSSPATDKAGAITLLLGKGQTLLKLDQPQAALDCFDEVLVLDPGHADALVRKGAALERLQRLDEAVECCDRAIARDNCMTMAYLYKGGVFNRMERYSEALECYEQALKSQQRGQAANVIMD
jgi:tetratricopeptide (TPR) repeat protein